MRARLSVSYEVVTSWIEALERLLACLKYLQGILAAATTEVLVMRSREVDIESPLEDECDPPQCPTGCHEPSDEDRQHRWGREVPVTNLAKDLERILESARELQRAMAKVVELESPARRGSATRAKRTPAKRRR